LITVVRHLLGKKPLVAWVPRNVVVVT